MKYKLTTKTINFFGRTLYQIEALEYFGSVSKGDCGGFIEREKNLSQDGLCWVYGNAHVYGNALVYGDARVYGNALVYGNARVYDDAQVCGDALVYGNAQVCGNAHVYGNTQVYGDARVYGNAQVYGNAHVYGNARVSKSQKISAGVCVDDLSKNLSESIRCQTGIIPINGKVILYKQVKKDLTSIYDVRFHYVIGEVAKEKNVKISDESCARGLHASNANYRNNNQNIMETTFIAIEVDLADIITVQEGKVRFKKGLVLGKYDIELSVKENT